MCCKSHIILLSVLWQCIKSNSTLYWRFSLCFYSLRRIILNFQSKNAQLFLLARDSRLLNVLASPYNSLTHEVKSLQLEKPLFLSRSHNPETSKANEVVTGKRNRRKKKTQEDETSVTSKIGSISANDSESVGTQESQEPTPKRSSKNRKSM